MTYCINVDLEQKKAWVYSPVAKELVEIGSQGSILAFQTAVDEFSVQLDYEQELALFDLVRNDRGEWLAVKGRRTFFIGHPERISFETLLQADRYFLADNG
jgi:hypothetical protein